MKSNFKSRFWKLSKWFGLLFVVLFIFRLTFGYLSNDTVNTGYYGNDFFSSLDNVRKNYASEKGGKISENVEQQASMASNQKFEKTATVKSKSSEFEKDDNLIKEKTKLFNAIIQYEQKLGQKGNREVHLLIGVNPAKFDDFYSEIKKIGTVKATEITKVDKTNEYKQLNAKKISLEKTLQSLIELKSRGGQISEFVALQDKILEIEGQLQEFGVELGNFDSENEFCTVKLSLYEGATEKNISFLYRVKVALEWTIKYFAVMIFSILCLSITIFVLLLIIDKLKLISAISNKLEN